MPEIRRQFHDDMAELERLVLAMGEEARDAVSHATRAIVWGDADEAEAALGFPTFVRSPGESKKLSASKGPMVVLSASGMACR